MADLMPSVRAQYSVKRWEYTLADAAGIWSMPKDKKEHHCILYDEKKQRISVMGTYGKFGYFEGSFKMGTNDALVAWWETTVSESGIAAASGSAWLTYTDTMKNGTQISTVTGGVSQNLPSTDYNQWLATDGFLKEDSSVDEKAHEAFMDFCLLTKPRSKAWSDVMGTAATSAGMFSTPPMETEYMKQLHATMWIGRQGSCRFCVNKYNLESEYSYQYSQEEADSYAHVGMQANDIEFGQYGDDAIKYSSSFGEGLAGKFIAESGPLKGITGTNILRIGLTDDGNFELIGYYCNTNAQRIRDLCYFERYQLSEGVVMCKFTSFIDPPVSSGRSLLRPAGMMALLLGLLAIECF